MTETTKAALKVATLNARRAHNQAEARLAGRYAGASSLTAEEILTAAEPYVRAAEEADRIVKSLEQG